MQRVVGALVAAAMAVLSHPALAAEVSLSDISGIWSSGQTTIGTSPAGLGSSEISWGTPVQAGKKSGYTFTPVPAPSKLTEEEPFTFGLFTHENFPITGTSLVWAKLQLVFDLNVNGVLHTLTANYLFNHTETPNIGRNNCCNDLVQFAAIANSFDTITIGSVKYAFLLDGFVTDAGKPVSFFSTEEGKSNTAQLVGRFTSVGPAGTPTEEPSPVPLPAPVVLLGFGIAGLAGVGRLRRKG